MITGIRSYRRPERVSALRSSGEENDELTRGSGYTVFSTLIAGMIAYGGIGWVVGHYTHIALLFPIGLLVGLAISVGWVIYQFGRPHKLGTAPKGDDR